MFVVSKLKDAGFLKALSERAGFGVDSAEIYGRGVQAVVAIANGGNIFKVYTSNQDQCGVDSSAREVAVLSAVGGYSGNLLETPRLISHGIFDRPFDWNHQKFVSFTEQSYMPGGHPYAPSETARIGGALAELHNLLRKKHTDIPMALESIPEYRLGLLREGGFIQTELRAEYLKLQRGINRLLSGVTLQPVHGDFLEVNIKVNHGKYAVIDFARAGLSIPEQDMTAYVTLSPVLKEVFASYAQHTGYHPVERNVRVLRSLNYAIMSEAAARKGDGYKARELGGYMKASLN